MKIRAIFLTSCALSLVACTAGNVQEALGTMKNPNPVLDEPGAKPDDINPFIKANYLELLKALESSPGTGLQDASSTAPPAVSPMQKYLNAGFALSDIYCDQFFRDAEESQRRRRFGRAATNDIGTAITTVLGLASAGESAVTGAAAVFGLSDSMWRNYDDAFVVSPDLSNVQSLVVAAQDVFRKRTFESALPSDYGKAQSVVLRYANLCSTLGMQALLNQSANQQRQELSKLAEPTPTPSPSSSGSAPAVQPTPNTSPPAQAAPQALPG